MQQQQHQYQCAAELFDRVMTLPPEQRAAYLEHSSGNDPELLARLRRMVRFVQDSDTTSDFLPEIRVVRQAPDAAASMIGVIVDRYRITNVIGEGGFGMVYAAEQVHPVRRTVALKILKGGMESQQVLARFEAERQMLALLDHPGIARIYDAGTTDQQLGCRPYFVMELVQGQPITDYCRQRELNCDARLNLIINVCQAVQHAHHKGIIHRDLKPSNILVTDIDGTPTPKIIDFGIAKVVHKSNIAGATPAFTNRMELLGTPQYMSPEQANSDLEAIDTRSDVYSLGAVLYELITGTTPLRSEMLRKASYTEIMDMILQQQVQRPSTRLRTLLQSHATTPGLQSPDATADSKDPKSEAESSADHAAHAVEVKFRSELDWIALKALAPERDRRYASAQALGDDLQRYLHHQPLEAGPPGTGYRVLKFMRRHRLGVAAAAMIAGAIITGAVLATFGMIQARISAAEAQDVNRFMHEVLTSADPNAHGAEVRLVEVLAHASAVASQRFKDHPHIEAQVRSMLGQVFLKLDMGQSAASEFDKSSSLYAALHGEQHPLTLNERLLHVRALCAQNRAHDAERAINDLLPLIESAPSRLDDRLLVEVRRMHAVVHKLRGRVHEAQTQLQALRQQLPQCNISNDDRALVLESLLSTLVSVSSSASDERQRELHRDMEAVSREMLTLLAHHSLPPVSALWAQVILAQALWERDEAVEAAEVATAVLEQTRSRLGECHVVHLRALRLLARACDRLGDAPRAAELMLEGLECSRRRAASGDPVALLSDIHDALPYLDRGGRWAEGEALAREYTQAVQRYAAGHHDMDLFGPIYLARFISLQGRLEEAGTDFERLMQREHEAGSITRAVLRMFAGSNLRMQGRFEEAQEHFTAAATFMGNNSQGLLRSYRDALHAEMTALYRAWGKPEMLQHLQNQPTASLRTSES